MRPTPLLLSLTIAASSKTQRGESMTSTTAKTGNVAAAEPGDTRLEPLFKALIQQRSESEQDSVIPSEGREGAYIGSGDGSVTGRRIRGTIRWSVYAGNCRYPLVRKGHKVPAGLHLCTVNPGGFIETHDGARIRFDGRGYGLLSPEKYRVSMTLAFGTEDPRYAWLTKLLGVVEGEVDAKAGRATWNVHVPPR